MANEANEIHFKKGEVLTADKLNLLAKTASENKLVGSYDTILTRGPSGQSLRSKTSTVTPDAVTGMGVSPKSNHTSTIESTPNGLRLYNAGKSGFANNVSPYLIEAITTGVLPRNFVSMPVLQNSPITEDILPVLYNPSLSALNETLRDLLYPSTANTLSVGYLSTLHAVSNGDKNNALIYGLATNYLSSNEPFPDNRMEYAYQATINPPEGGLSAISIDGPFDLALSSTARTVNYLNMADVFSLTMPDSIARGQLVPYERATSRSIGSMFIPLSGLTDGDGESSYLYDHDDYLSNDFRTGAQLYGFAVQTNDVMTLSGGDVADYYYPYFNADTYNGLSPIKVTSESAGNKIQAEAGGESYVEHPKLRPYLSAHPTTPGELALGLRNGLDIVVRVHDQPTRQQLGIQVEDMLSTYPELSTVQTTVDASEGLRTPMVSYIPANMLLSEVTGVFPVIEDVYWDPETHSLMKTYRYWEITNGKITAIKGGADLSSIGYIDENDELVEKTVELPIRTIILQGVPEQI